MGPSISLQTKNNDTLLSIQSQDQIKNLSASKKQKDVTVDARDYNELMDEYSLHQLIVRRGTILDSTPEFNSFKRTYLQKWG